jgi:hypothetical protein
MTFGRRGTYLNTSIPGTGLYNRQKISGRSSSYSGSAPVPPKAGSSSGCLILFVGLVLFVLIIANGGSGVVAFGVLLVSFVLMIVAPFGAKKAVAPVVPAAAPITSVVEEPIPDPTPEVPTDVETPLPEPLVEEVASIKKEKDLSHEEIEAFAMIKSLLHNTLTPSRIFYRSTQSYLSVIVDDNNRKLICRLYLNGQRKQIAFVDETKKEERIELHSLDDIYSFEDRLKAIAGRY